MFFVLGECVLIALRGGLEVCVYCMVLAGGVLYLPSAPSSPPSATADWKGTGAAGDGEIKTPHIAQDMDLTHGFHHHRGGGARAKGSYGGFC